MGGEEPDRTEKRAERHDRRQHHPEQLVRRTAGLLDCDAAAEPERLCALVDGAERHDSEQRDPPRRRGLQHLRRRQPAHGAAAARSRDPQQPDVRHQHEVQHPESRRQRLDGDHGLRSGQHHHRSQHRRQRRDIGDPVLRRLRALRLPDRRLRAEEQSSARQQVRDLRRQLVGRSSVADQVHAECLRAGELDRRRPGVDLSDRQRLPDAGAVAGRLRRPQRRQLSAGVLEHLEQRGHGRQGHRRRLRGTERGTERIVVPDTAAAIFVGRRHDTVFRHSGFPSGKSAVRELRRRRQRGRLSRHDGRQHRRRLSRQQRRHPGDKR